MTINPVTSKPSQLLIADDQHSLAEALRHHAIRAPGEHSGGRFDDDATILVLALR